MARLHAKQQSSVALSALSAQRNRLWLYLQRRALRCVYGAADFLFDKWTVAVDICHPKVLYQVFMDWLRIALHFSNIQIIMVILLMVGETHVVAQVNKKRYLLCLRVWVTAMYKLRVKWCAFLIGRWRTSFSEVSYASKEECKIQISLY